MHDAEDEYQAADEYAAGAYDRWHTEEYYPEDSEEDEQEEQEREAK